MKIRGFLLLVTLSLPLIACYEEPVRDHLHLVFTPGPAIILTAVREIASPAGADNPAVEERMDEARSDLDSGWDRWSRSFAELNAIADRRSIERREGRPSRGIHSALVDSFRPVERLLGNEGLGAFFDDTAGVRELQLHPTGGCQADRRQRAMVDEALSDWSSEIALYLEATTTFYAYLDRAPNRAIPCFSHIFDDDTGTSDPLNDREEALLDEVKESMERVATILLIDSDHAYSLNELSRLVFDTYQGRLTIAVDGPIIEVSGFVESDGVLERPPVSLWRALETTIDRWMVPDLVTAMVRPGPEEIQPLPDGVEFASLTRRWAPPPEPTDVEAEMRRYLQPEPVYRVRWQTRAGPDENDEIDEQALDLLASAEQNLPE